MEMKEYGEEYGTQIVKNSKALAKAMDEKGFNVLGKNKGYTETHLLLVDAGGHVNAAPAKHLERARILCSDDFSGNSPEIRIGTPEITRRGMKEKEMDIIAEFFKRALIDKEDPESIAFDVEAFSRQFTGCEYSF
jgi:glycine hydroxymethyltransferase